MVFYCVIWRTHMHNYLTEYYGPTFVIKNPVFKKKEEVEKMYQVCINEQCDCYKTKSSNFLMNFCPKCGSKLGKIENKFEMNMDIYDSINPNRNLLLSVFDNDLNLVFIPDFDHERWTLNTCHVNNFFVYKSVDHCCQNESCNSFESHIPYDDSYCTDCGQKVDFDINEDIETNFDDFLTNQFTQTIRHQIITINNKEIIRKDCLEDFFFVDNPVDFDKNLENFKDCQLTQDAIVVLEEIYGEGSVKIVNAHLQYNNNY